jgi:putative transposase
VFGAAPKSEAEPVIDVKTLHAKIGELALGPVFCPARSARRVWRRAQENDRSNIKAQRQPPGRRAGAQPEQRHCQPRPVSDADLKLRRRIDKLHMEFPFAGARMLRDLLAQEGVKAGRLHVATLMKRMGVEALYRKPNTSKPAPGHKTHPYLLRKLAVTRPNQVWAMDITYIPMARGFIYLAAVLDWFTRRVLAWRVSITLEADFCIAAVEEALTRHGKPEIFNTDQGSQFTGAEFIKAPAAHEIKISMDGKGAWRDNVFVERLWRTIKYEEVCLRAYAGVSEACASVGRYLGFYNGRRPHSSLDGKTPDQACFNPQTPEVAAA